MYFVGSTVSDVALTTTNAAGTPEADAGVVFTVTRPDGTTSTPATTNPSTGVYQALYVPTVAGRHTWSAATASHGPQTGAFNVNALASLDIISLAEAKSALNMVTTTNDDELRRVIGAASGLVEGYAGPFVKQVKQQTVYPTDSCMLVLDYAPILSLTSVVSTNGFAQVYDTATMYPDLATGVIRAGLTGQRFWTPVIVTYVAGMTTIPDDVIEATRVVVKHLWETQRGSLPSADGGEFVVPVGYSMPNRAKELLSRYVRVAVA